MQQLYCRYHVRYVPSPYRRGHVSNCCNVYYAGKYTTWDHVWETHSGLYKSTNICTQICKRRMPLNNDPASQYRVNALHASSNEKRKCTIIYSRFYWAQFDNNILFKFLRVSHSTFVRTARSSLSVIINGQIFKTKKSLWSLQSFLSCSIWVNYF